MPQENVSPAERPSIFEAFRRLADRDPAAAALVDGPTGSITTREELFCRAQALAGALAARELHEGDLVAVQLPNSVDFVAVFLAILQLRLTAVPIDRDAREAEVVSILNHLNIRALVYRGSAAGLPTITIRENIATAPLRDPYVPLIKLTSGSTGLPKGIITTEGNLQSDCHNICQTMAISPLDRNLGAIPFSHSYGFSNLITPLLTQGTTIVVSNDYLPLSVLDLCNRFRCTVVPGIPMIFDHLSQIPRSDGDFETVRTFISAGAPLSASLSRRFLERFGKAIHSFYGCSECGGISYDGDGGSIERGHVGSPLAGVRLEIDAVHGRLVVRSEAVAAGYINASMADDERFGDGTFLTDDLANVNDHGCLELTGRFGDLINTAGKKVNPREVEVVLLQLSGIRQVKVYGEPAGARGEVVAAAIVADPDVTRDQVRQHCRLHLSAHKVPRIVKLIESIPVDERGKVKRSALAEL